MAGSLDWLLPLLEQYPPHVRDACTVYPVYPTTNRDETLFLHPGELVFDRFRAYVCQRFEQDALRGAVFIDPTAQRPYLFHLVQVVVRREADMIVRALRHSELLETRLVGLRQDEYGNVETCSPEQLLLLRGSADLPPSAISFAATAETLRAQAETFVRDYVAASMIQQLRQDRAYDMAQRLTFVNRSFGYQEPELTERRRLLREKANQGDSYAKGELTKVKQQQNALDYRREEAIAAIEREPQLIVAGPIPIPAADLLPTNLTVAWKGQSEVTALDIADALSAKVGVPLPWHTVRQTIDAAFNARYIALSPDSGRWPCDYAHAGSVKLRDRNAPVPTTQSSRSAPSTQSPQSSQSPQTASTPRVTEDGNDYIAPPSNALVAEATLSPAEIQNLEEQMSRITHLCAASDLKPTFHVRIEIAGEHGLSNEKIAELNAVLQEVSERLRLS